jgi:hypothetical protein
MPKVTIARDWPDGDRLRVTIETEPGHPDGLLGETKRVAREAFAEALTGLCWLRWRTRSRTSRACRTGLPFAHGSVLESSQAHR